MIVVVLLVGGWLGWLVRSARIQREAVAAIQQAGGSVYYYDWEWRSGQYLEGTEPPAPRWVVSGSASTTSGNVAEMCNGNARGDAVLAKVGELHAP